MTNCAHSSALIGVKELRKTSSGMLRAEHVVFEDIGDDGDVL